MFSHFFYIKMKRLDMKEGIGEIEYSNAPTARDRAEGFVQNQTPTPQNKPPQTPDDTPRFLEKSESWKEE